MSTSLTLRALSFYMAFVWLRFAAHLYHEEAQCAANYPSFVNIRQLT